MSSFVLACQELLELRRNSRMAIGISFSRAVAGCASCAYLKPLRLSKTLLGPLQIDFIEKNTFSVGRESYCDLVMPEDMFEEEENRKHDKD